MCTFFNQFELEVFESVAIEVVGYLCGTINDVCEFVDLQKLVILFGVIDT